MGRVARTLKSVRVTSPYFPPSQPLPDYIKPGLDGLYRLLMQYYFAELIQGLNQEPSADTTRITPMYVPSCSHSIFTNVSTPRILRLKS